MKAIIIAAALCFSSFIFAADQSMSCCGMESGSAMKCGATMNKQDVRTQLMKMKHDLKLSDGQIVKIADALSAKAPQACCGSCSKTEGKASSCCDHSGHDHAASEPAVH